ncbi:fatty acid-binding protein DegV [Prevotella multiformis]|nr:fatty acid-binding protein DegV [Prevotella multiformis]
MEIELKAYALAGYDYPKSDGLTKGDKLQDKMQERKIDAMPVH